MAASSMMEQQPDDTEATLAPSGLETTSSTGGGQAGRDQGGTDGGHGASTSGGGGGGGGAAEAAAATTAPSAQQLQEQLHKADAQVQRLSQQLQHYRSWVASVNTHVLRVNPKAVQNAKRLYVGNLPADITEEELRGFLNHLMQQTGAQVGREAAVVQCHITQERNFAFAEFRSVEEASNAMGLDGVTLRDCTLKIRRPSNYDLATSLMLGPVTPDPTMDTACLNLAKPVQEESPNKLFIGGLPCEWPEPAVRMLLDPYGPLKAFNLVMDKNTGNSKGYAFCEFEDPAVTDKAIAGLNGQRAGSKTLTVKRAAEGARQASAAGAASSTHGGMSGGAEEASRGFAPGFSTRKAGSSSTTTTTYIMTPPPPTMVMGPMQVPGSARSHTSQSPFPPRVAAAPGRTLPGEGPMAHMGPMPQHMVQPYMVQPYAGTGQPHPMHFGPTAPAPMGAMVLTGPAPFPAEHGARPLGRGMAHGPHGGGARGVPQPPSHAAAWTSPAVGPAKPGAGAPP